MPVEYEAMRDDCMNKKMSQFKADHNRMPQDGEMKIMMDDCKEKAARIYNSRHPDSPMGNKD